MYEWKIIMNNGKEYLVKSDIISNGKFLDELYGISNIKPTPKINLVSYELSEKDKNGCSNVVIISNNVSSVEFNFK